MKFFALLINPWGWRNPRFAEVSESPRLYNPSVKWKSSAKKSFTPLFEDYAPDLCSSYLAIPLLLSRALSVPLRIVSRSDFFRQSFCIPVSEEVSDTSLARRVIFKMFEKIAVSRFSLFFLQIFSSSVAGLFHVVVADHAFSLIWIGGTFHPMKFESRSERKPGDDESCLSFL